MPKSGTLLQLFPCQKGSGPTTCQQYMSSKSAGTNQQLPFHVCTSIITVSSFVSGSDLNCPKILQYAYQPNFIVEFRIQNWRNAATAWSEVRISKVTKDQLITRLAMLYVHLFIYDKELLIKKPAPLIPPIH